MIYRLARTLLYKGYLLYPYRADSTKNRERFSFGTLYPRAWCEAERCDDHALQTEVLATTREADAIAISVRFLRLVEGAGAGGWQEAREHAIELAAGPRARVGAAESRTTRVEIDGLVIAIEVTLTPDDDDSLRIRVRVANETPVAMPHDDDVRARRQQVQRCNLASTHVIYRCSGGAFVSLLEPPPVLARAASRCENFGAWPVLVGDEILTLRVLALSDAEKEQVRVLDPRARAILDRCERLTAAEFAALDGAIGTRSHDGLAIGDHVVVRAAALAGIVTADALDSLLGGKHAEIVAVVEPIDGGDAMFAVVFDDDPGRDRGIAGKPGHRFFFRACELELLS